jgi:hypothetical protein
VGWDEAQNLTVTASRKKDPELARVDSERKPFDQKVKLLPNRAWRPQVGIALLYTDAATYPEYGTQKNGDQFEVVVKDTIDRRASYGLGLAMTFRGLDRRIDGGWTLWPVEVLFNPSDSDRAVAAGFAVSWKAIKLSAGTIWNRRKVLDGIDTGQLLPTSDALVLRDSYGSPEFYIGVSVVGWAPFRP